MQLKKIHYMTHQRKQTTRVNKPTHDQKRKSKQPNERKTTAKSNNKQTKKKKSKQQTDEQQQSKITAISPPRAVNVAGDKRPNAEMSRNKKQGTRNRNKEQGTTRRMNVKSVEDIFAEKCSQSIERAL